MKIYTKLSLTTIIIFFLIIALSSIVYLYDNRAKIASFINFSYNKENSHRELDNFYAKEIMKGGYILHFRHAERDKWIDIKMYDTLESDLHNNGEDASRYAENDYFADAVCLNKRGKIQAKAMGETLKHIGLPIGAVHSSVSCRARQTANLAFGGYDKLHRDLVHRGPYNEDFDEHVLKLKELYMNFPNQEGTNTVVSAHNGVIHCDMFINDKCPKHLSLEEGGFYVIRRTKDGLVFEHEFHDFYFFNRVFYKR